MSTAFTSLNNHPDFSSVAILTIDSLAPLSMVAKMPGKYYRSQPSPTDEMLYGLLENALGWHIAEKDRNEVIKQLQKKHGKTARESGVGYRSLLQFHLRFGLSQMPQVMHYDDYWSQHLSGPSFVGGSREYDTRAIPLMNAVAGKKVTINDRAEAKKESELLTTFQEGQTVHLNVLRPYFPQYYISPTPREYVVPDGPYRYRVETSAELASMIAEAVDDPAAPLYLGSNDGWVDVHWRVMS